MVSLQKLISILADEKYHSGAELGQQLGVSRAAIWKLIHKLESQYGLEVFAVRGKGYRLARSVELLDKHIITGELSGDVQTKLEAIEILFDTPSTNQYLNQKSFSANKSPYLVVAERQTEGKGRRGRKWVSPFGQNIYYSLLWHFDLAPAQLACLGLFVSVAIARVLKTIGIHDIGVKWPNDIYWHDKKLGGILLEMRGESAGPSTVVIGFGLNLSLNTDNQEINKIDQPWIDIESILGERPGRNSLVAKFTNEIFSVLQSIPAQHEDLLEEWRLLDVLKNQQVAVHFPDKIVKGKATGINQNGGLIVRTAQGEMSCYSGEVSVRRD